MGGKHPNNIDPRPKRRKASDNPYTIFTTGIDSARPRYYISFRDAAGTDHCIEIDKTLFDTFDRFELEDLSHLNEVERHHDLSAQIEERTAEQADGVEEIVQRRIESEELHAAIVRLPDTQRRRVVLYYFGGYTYDQIADMEGCTLQAVEQSVSAGLRKLKKFLRNRLEK